MRTAFLPTVHRNVLNLLRGIDSNMPHDYYWARVAAAACASPLALAPALELALAARRASSCELTYRAMRRPRAHWRSMALAVLPWPEDGASDCEGAGAAAGDVAV